MAPPPIHLFLTTIASQHALRQRQEFLLRTLEVKKIPFIPYDLASDEAAKKIWKRKVPLDKQQLPGFLVGGKFIGTFQDFEQAVEFGELEQFLQQNEEHVPDQDYDKPLPPQQPAVGVPGVATPEQMTPERLKPHIYNLPPPSPLGGKKSTPVNKRVGEFDLGEEIRGYGLQGVKVTHDELEDLVKELGLGGDEAGDLIKGLSDMTVLDDGDSREDPPPTIKNNAQAEAPTETKEEEKKEGGKVGPHPELKEQKEEAAKVS